MLSQEDIEEEFKVDFQEYYHIKGPDKELRDLALEQLAKALAEAGNTTKKIMLKVIGLREEQRKTTRKTRFLRGKINNGSTTMVTIMEGDIQKDLTGKKEIEEALSSNNMGKYQQSFHTPFMTSPLKEEFGFKGLTTASQAVLVGIYEPGNQVDHITREFMAELEMPQAVRNLGPQMMEIAIESFRAFWQKATEKTSCYPDDLSFATMKAGVMYERISKLECELINVALKSGYSLERWRHLLEVMIVKNKELPYTQYADFQWIVIMTLSI